MGHHYDAKDKKYGVARYSKPKFFVHLYYVTLFKRNDYGKNKK